MIYKCNDATHLKIDLLLVKEGIFILQNRKFYLLETYSSVIFYRFFFSYKDFNNFLYHKNFTN